MVVAPVGSAAVQLTVPNSIADALSPMLDSSPRITWYPTASATGDQEIRVPAAVSSSVNSIPSYIPPLLWGTYTVAIADWSFPESSVAVYVTV